MLLLGVVAVVLTYSWFASLRRRSYTGYAVVALLVIVCIAGERLSHVLAFVFQSAPTRRITATTFFGSPPVWILPCVIEVTGVVTLLLVPRRIRGAAMRE
jgi:hypothetical protein